MMKLAVLAVSSLQMCIADLRLAAQPRANRRRNNVGDKDMFEVLHQSRRRYQRFNVSKALYFEPSDFKYQGLIQQREKAYDNFLRSNIDNEQDKRNFNEEDGKDHLPFRTYEGATTDKGQDTQKYKIPDGSPGPHLEVNINTPMLMPLRWNNPHSSELEVNVWIVKGAKPYVVPVRKPTCSGEGYQDNAFHFTIPSNFHNVAKASIPGYAGCQQRDECTLQIYAHSVESRTYAIGIPLIVNNYTAGGGTNTEQNIKPHCTDVGTDLSSLRLICRPSYDAGADIKNAEVYHARLVSDVFNHAYQNNDYSPYSGQQCKEISKNLQAACVLKMLPANRGELGQQALLRDNRDGFHTQRHLDRKAKDLYRKYESMANSLIKLLQHDMLTTDTLTAAASHGYEYDFYAKGECKKGIRRASHDVASAEACMALCSAESDCTYAAYDGTMPHSRKRCSRAHGDEGCDANDMQPHGCYNQTSRKWGECQYLTWKKREIKAPSKLVTQKLEKCFRCKEVGSTVGYRQETTTYIPSYHIPTAKKCNALKTLLKDNKMYRNLVSEDCHVNIYVATLNDLIPEFNKAQLKNITYLGPMIKTTMATMADATNFKKRDANGAVDNEKGAYAARQAYAKHGFPAWNTGKNNYPIKNITPISDTADGRAPSRMSAEAEAELAKPCPITKPNCNEIKIPFSGNVGDAADMDAQMNDANCEDPSISNDTTVCLHPTEILFASKPNLEAEVIALNVSGGTTAKPGCPACPTTTSCGPASTTNGAGVTTTGTTAATTTTIPTKKIAGSASFHVPGDVDAFIANTAMVNAMKEGFAAAIGVAVGRFSKFEVTKKTRRRLGMQTETSARQLQTAENVNVAYEVDLTGLATADQITTTAQALQPAALQQQVQTKLTTAGYAGTVEAKTFNAGTVTTTTVATAAPGTTAGYTGTTTAGGGGNTTSQMLGVVGMAEGAHCFALFTLLLVRMIV
jgi:hypothetical protein